MTPADVSNTQFRPLTRPAAPKLNWRTLACALAALAAITAAGCSGAPRSPESMTLAEYREIEPQLIARAERATARGDDRFADGDYQDAVLSYAEAVEAYPAFAPAWNNMGVALMELGEFVDAERAFRRAERENPRDYRPVFNRGVMYYDRGFVRESRSLFQRAIEIDDAQLAPLWYAIKADLLLGVSDEQTLENVERALMLEDEPRYVQRLKLERARLEKLLSGGDVVRSAPADEEAIELIELEEANTLPPGDDAERMPGSDAARPERTNPR